MWISSFLCTICQKDCPFLIDFGTLVENRLTMHVFFWALYSIPLGYLSGLMQVPHCFDCYSFVVNFENRKYEIVNVLLFQYCFCSLGLPEIPYEF